MSAPHPIRLRRPARAIDLVIDLVLAAWRRANATPHADVPRVAHIVADLDELEALDDLDGLDHAA